jgi:hypothetical protein
MTSLFDDVSSRGDEARRHPNARRPDNINDKTIGTRIRGLVEDQKTVNSAQWLQDWTRLESPVVSSATFLVCLDAALVSNIIQFGQNVDIAVIWHHRLA